MLSYYFYLLINFFLLLQTFLNQGYESESLPDTNAVISLPSALADYLKPGQRNKTRIQFNFFGTQKLFQVQISLAVSYYSTELYHPTDFVFLPYLTSSSCLWIPNRIRA